MKPNKIEVLKYEITRNVQQSLEDLKELFNGENDEADKKLISLLKHNKIEV